MGTNGYAKYLENTFIVFCIRNGGLLCHEKKELETIIIGKNEENLFTIPVWDFFNCSFTPFLMAKIL